MTGLSFLKDKRCFLIAEAGTSHGGDLEHAFRLIDSACAAGADAVKFQAVIADEIIHPKTGWVDLPGGKIPLYERFKSLERGLDFYRALKERTEERGLVFLCTPFGLASAAMLHQLQVVAYKVASPELNHFPLLRKLSEYAKPILLSTGVSTLEDIERALEITGKKMSILLHCVTAYPAPEEEYNLRLIPNLRLFFGLPVGLSDHSLDAVLVPSLAVNTGAVCIEKHLTLARGSGGLDDPIALDPAGFTRMVSAVRKAERDGARATERHLIKEYGRKRVEAVLGNGLNNGQKRLARSEAGNYLTTNRSLHALTDIGQGEVFDEQNITIIRTEKNLRPGIGPQHYDLLLGRHAKRDIASGQGLAWDDF